MSWRKTYGLDSVMVASNIHNDEQLGQFIIENDLHPDVAAIPDDSLYLLDKRRIGELQRKNEGGVLIEGFYVVTGDYEIPEVYDGKNDYKGRLLVLKPTVLKESYRTSENQLFVAEGGFGCSPNSRGRKVFGKFLIDGEETNFNRDDFFGIIKDECIPEWAAEKLAELEPPDQDESKGIIMGGM